MKKQSAKEDTTETRRDLAAQAARPLRNYLATETGSAGLLLAAAVIALVWVNSPFSDSYNSLWDTVLAFNLGDWSVSLDLRHWIDEGLMALFFFVIGPPRRRPGHSGSRHCRKLRGRPSAASTRRFLLMNDSRPRSTRSPVT